MKDATIEALGQAADKVSVDKDSTVIVEGLGKSEAIVNRVAVIKSQIEPQPWSLTGKLQERLAKLSAVLLHQVGAR